MLQALCLVGATPQDGQITSVVANHLGNGVELVVRGEGLPKPKTFSYLGGKLRVVEFDAEMAGSGSKTNVGYGGVQSFTTTWYSTKPPKVRINVKVDEAGDPLVYEAGDGWHVAFNATTAAVPESKVVKMAVVTMPAATKVSAFPDRVPPLYPATAATAHVAPDRITIDFVNTDIVQVLKAIALQAGVNIVSSPDVKTNVTVSLKDVSVEEALRIVTSLSSLAYAKVGAAYVVAPNDKLDAITRQIRGERPMVAPVKPDEPMVTRSYYVQGGLAADLVKAVGGDGKTAIAGVTMRGTPPTSVSRQTVVLTGTAADVDAMIDTLKMMDSSDESSASFQMYDVKYLDPRSARESVLAAVPGLRVTLAPSPAANPRLYKPAEALAQANEGAAAAPNQGGQVGPGVGTPNNSNPVDVTVGNTGTTKLEGLQLPYDSYEPVAFPMRLVLRGTPEQLQQANDYLSQTDTAPKQVAIELRAMEITQEEAQKIGLDWSILSGSGLVRLLRVNEGFGQDAAVQGSVNSTFKGGSVLGTLDQLSDKNHLIARPNLMAVDGRESEVFVGDVIRYIKQIQATQNGVTVQTDEVRVGVRMAVLARAGADGNISLDLRPTVSFLRAFTDVPGGGVLPQTSERTSQNSAIIKSGQTIALGGLIQDNERTDVRGIPFLKDLPIIGQLFRRTDKDRVRTEVVFFLTAKLVDSENAGTAAAPKPDK
jgi:type II secretory pathway component GspD/PulD (secretin)